MQALTISGGTIAESVRAGIQAAVRDPRDRPAADLALTYAAHIDAGGDVTKLGPCLLKTLEALGMTPKSRSAAPVAPPAGGGATGDNDKPAPRPLDELRDRRRTRAHRAAALDPTAP